MGVWDGGGKNLTVFLSFLPFSTFIYNYIKLSTLELKIHFQFLQKTFLFLQRSIFNYFFKNRSFNSFKKIPHSNENEIFSSRLVYFLKFNLFRELLELDWLTTCCCFSLLWFFFIPSSAEFITFYFHVCVSKKFYERSGLVLLIFESALQCDLCFLKLFRESKKYLLNIYFVLSCQQMLSTDKNFQHTLKKERVKNFN